MNLEPNSYFLKISGKANIPEPLKLGDGYKLTLDGEIVSATDSNNQDGTFDRAFLFKPILCEVHDNYGNIQKAKDMRSWSQILKRAVWKTWQVDEGDINEDEAYERTMKYILANLGDIYEAAKKNK